MEKNRRDAYMEELRERYEEEINRFHKQINKLLEDKVHIMGLIMKLHKDGVIEMWYTTIDGVGYIYYKYNWHKYII